MISYNRTNVLTNNYQGPFKKVLTVCSAGCLRSPTAAHILAAEPYNFNTRCCGLDTHYAIVPIEDGLVLWADEIIVFSSEQKSEILNILDRLSIEYGFTLKKPVFNLDIPDNFQYRSPKLIDLIRKNYDSHLLKASS